ncbi:hypothetical protein [Nesterenkonia rhizosphaerae]|uniref:Uncharacterized protein n=1 Tax=Nesterenkonia rhizosphaerae TaxID=1348272 RepID=A0ABP9FSV6_9MICC
MTTTSQAKGAQQYQARNASATLTHGLKNLLDLIVGHESVHPDTNKCGGVGGCLMLRTEHEAWDRLQESLEGLAGDFEVTITVTPRRAHEPDPR